MKDQYSSWSLSPDSPVLIKDPHFEEGFFSLFCILLISNIEAAPNYKTETENEIKPQDSNHSVSSKLFCPIISKNRYHANWIRQLSPHRLGR